MTILKFRNIIAFTTYISLIKPKNIKEAFVDVDEIVDMQEELIQLGRNKVCHLVPRPDNRVFVRTRWVRGYKLDYQGNIIRNKAKFVCKTIIKKKTSTLLKTSKFTTE